MASWAKDARVYATAPRDALCCRCDGPVRAGEPIVWLKGLRAHQRPSCTSPRPSLSRGLGVRAGALLARSSMTARRVRSACGDGHVGRPVLLNLTRGSNLHLASERSECMS